MLRWRIAQFFELLWWRLYLLRKDKQTYLSRKQAYWRLFLEKSGIKLQTGSRILDAGCGPSGIFSILGEQHKVDALDPLLEAYEAKLGHFKKSDYPQVRFIAEALESYRPVLPYDCIFCLNVINHVADLEAALAGLAQCAKPGGNLFLAVDAHHFSFLKPLFRAIPGDILHPHQHEIEDYVQFVEKAGFRVERTQMMKRDGLFNYYLLVATRLG